MKMINAPIPSMKEQDAQKVVDLIVKDILDPYKIEDYKHVKSVATTLGWSAHRLFQAIKTAEVQKIVDNEAQSKIKTKTS